MDSPISRVLLFCLIIDCFTFFAYSNTGCQFEECSNDYRANMEAYGLADVEASAEYCAVLKTYLKCMRATSNACRGELHYQGTMYAFTRINQKHCRGANHTQRSSLPRRREMAPLPSCKYYGSYRFRHCSIYGRPHLKTFEGTRETCRPRDSWTMLDNSYMSVVMAADRTSHPKLIDVNPPTKITIIVKGLSTPCTLEKSYVATASKPLPTSFTDGTDRSGPDRTVTLTVLDDQTIEINMRYIASRLVVYKINNYLTFSAHLPEEVVQSSSTYAEGDEKQLCLEGCAARETLPQTDRVAVDAAISRCAAENLTDEFLDSCIFDGLTIGLNDPDLMTGMKYALEDATHFDPSSISNRSAMSETLFADNASQAISNLTTFSRLAFSLLSLLLTRYSADFIVR